MKLTIGENIRILRRKNDMTQEQLAERLGISYQSVSRWENCVTYPDLELIPTLAKLFSVTTDELLGMPSAEREAQAAETFRELRRECSKAEPCTERITALLRDIKRNYIAHRPNSDLWSISNARAFRDPEILPEVRAVFEEFMKTDHPKLGAIDLMSRVEEEERLDELLNRYAVGDNYFTESSLRIRRYLDLGDLERYEQVRRWKLYGSVCELFGDSCYFSPSCDDRETLGAADRFRESLLELLCEGSNAVCLFTADRLELGFKRAGRLARDGELTEAIGILHECVEQLEEMMKLGTTVEIPTGSRWLDGLEVTAGEDFGELGYRRERGIIINARFGSHGFAHMIYPSEFLSRLDGAEFDALRADAGFAAICERLSAMVVGV